MFTGLIQDVGFLRERTRVGDAAKLWVETQLPVQDVEIGESIAVSGACLTVEAAAAERALLRFHALAETLDRTSLGLRPIGGAVNLERALRLGDRLGGHMVQGHVDAAAPVLFIGREGDDMVLRVALPPVVRDLVIPKGSIAVEGVSLTIAHLDDEAFECRIIPHTRTATNLHTLAPGDTVNLEADMLGKYVARLLGKGRQVSLSPGEGPVDEDFLARAGFE